MSVHYYKILINFYQEKILMKCQNYVFWWVRDPCSLTDNRYLLRCYSEAEQHLSNRILRVKLWKTSYNCGVEILTEISATIRFYKPIESIIVVFLNKQKVNKRFGPLVGDQGLKTTKHTFTDFRNLFGYLKTPRSSRPSSNFSMKAKANLIRSLNLLSLVNYRLVKFVIFTVIYNVKNEFLQVVRKLS